MADHHENPSVPTGQPPYSNRGVYPPSAGGADHGAGAVFDAYNSTVYAHPDLIAAELMAALAMSSPTLEDGPKVPNYERNQLMVDRLGHRICSIRSGGQNHFPFVEVKGAATAVVADTLRRSFNHSPSRVDSAFDRTAPRLFEDLNDLAKRYERERGLKLDYAGAAVDHPDRGTTIYLGSRKSQVMVRIYQKGLQMAEAGGHTARGTIPDEWRNWVRIELEFKPQKRPAREAAARLSPRDVWGVSQWTRDFAMDALSIDAERCNVSVRRESNQERALRHMAIQYRAVLAQLVRDCGGDRAAAMEHILDLADLLPAKAA